LAMARRASVLKTAIASAARTGKLEAHRPSRLLHLPGSLALRADDLPATHRAGAAALLADVLAQDVETRLRAVDRVPETDLDAVTEIGAGLRTRLTTASATPAKQVREDTREAAELAGALPPAALPLRTETKVGKIESAETETAGRRCARRAATRPRIKAG